MEWAIYTVSHTLLLVALANLKGASWKSRLGMKICSVAAHQYLLSSQQDTECWWRVPLTMTTAIYCIKPLQSLGGALLSHHTATSNGVFALPWGGGAEDGLLSHVCLLIIVYVVHCSNCIVHMAASAVELQAALTQCGYSQLLLTKALFPKYGLCVCCLNSKSCLNSHI